MWFFCNWHIDICFVAHIFSFPVSFHLTVCNLAQLDLQPCKESPSLSVSGSLPSWKPALLAQVWHSRSASLEPQPAEKMTDSTPPDPTAVPHPAVVVDPAVVNGQCEQADPQQQQQQQQQPNTESQGEGFKMDQEMKITDSIDDRGRRCEIGSKFRAERAQCVMPGGATCTFHYRCRGNLFTFVSIQLH